MTDDGIGRVNAANVPARHADGFHAAGVVVGKVAARDAGIDGNQAFFVSLIDIAAIDVFARRRTVQTAGNRPARKAAHVEFFNLRASTVEQTPAVTATPYLTTAPRSPSVGNRAVALREFGLAVFVKVAADAEVTLAALVDVQILSWL